MLVFCLEQLSFPLQRLPDSHTRLLEAERIAQFLIQDRQAGVLGHLNQARVLYLVSEREVIFRGGPANAYICVPRVQGFMAGILEDLLANFARDQFDGHDPDFVVRVDRAAWDTLAYTEPARDFWRARRQFVPDSVEWSIGRERLLFHELKHVYQREDKDGFPRINEEDGRPVLALRTHDVERFHDELESYGPTVCDSIDAALAIAEGARQEGAARQSQTRKAS